MRLPPHLCSVNWRDFKGFLFPKAQRCPSSHLTNAAVSSQPAENTVFSVTLSFFLQLFPILPGHCVCQNQWGGETVRKSECYSYFNLSLGKSQTVSSALCVSLSFSHEGVIERGLDVCTHHSCFILPALASRSSGLQPLPVNLGSFWCCCMLKLSPGQPIPSPWLSVPRVISETVCLGAAESSIQTNNETKKDDSWYNSACVQLVGNENLCSWFRTDYEQAD